jgi:hypothetical protein
MHALLYVQPLVGVNKGDPLLITYKGVDAANMMLLRKMIKILYKQQPVPFSQYEVSGFRRLRCQ